MCFTECPLIWGLFDVLMIISLELGVLEKNSREVECPSYYIKLEGT